MSLTYAATLAGIISQVLSLMGIEASIDALGTTINTLASISAGIVALYGRVKAGGITAFGLRK